MKLGECVPHIALIPMAIPLKLFLVMVPGSSADVTRALCGYFRGGFVYVVYVPLCLKAPRETSNAVRMPSLIF